MDLNLSFRKYRHLFAVLLGVLSLAVSCGKEPAGVTEPEPEKPAIIQFNVLDDSDTKLSYEGVHTSFVDGESIGCVVASRDGEEYTFCSLTEWSYEEGILHLQTEDDEYIGNYVDDDDKAYKGYVVLKKDDADYTFIFYYPYVEGTVTAENWKEYPMPVGTNYSSGSSTLSHSDHLWVRYDFDRGAAETKVTLVFNKKTATVDVHCDKGDGYTINNVWIDAMQGTEGIVTRMNMDLTTGAFTTDTPYDGLIYPALLNDFDHAGEEDCYRMLFVPQTVKSWRLHVVVTKDGSAPVEYSIPLESKLKTLEGGKQYILHVASKGEGLILINDWNTDTSDDLFGEEVEVPSGLSMWSDRDPDKSDEVTVIKNGETLYIEGTGLVDDGGDRIVHHIEIGGVKVKEWAFTDGNRISFSLPELAQDNVVYLVMPSGVKVSPGRIETVKPVAQTLDPESFDMQDYEEGESSVDIGGGSDLDLVSKVIFGNGYSSDVSSLAGDNKSMTVLIPKYAHSGNLMFELKNGMVVDSGLYLEILNSIDETIITSVNGVYKAGATIMVSGTHLNAVGEIHLTRADDPDTPEEETLVKLYRGQDFMVSQDGTLITFRFPEEARDGNMVFYLYNTPTVVHTESYETVRPTYLEVYKYSDRVYVLGVDLDVVAKVMIGGYEVEDAYIEGNMIYFAWDKKYPLKSNEESKLKLTTKHDKNVLLSYDFTPQLSVTSITSPLGNLSEDIKNIVYVASGIEITLHGENLDLAQAVCILDKVIEDFTLSGDNTTLTFIFPDDVTLNGMIDLRLKAGSIYNAGSYRLREIVGSEVTINSVERIGTDRLDVVVSDASMVTSAMSPINYGISKSGNVITINCVDPVIKGVVVLETSDGGVMYPYDYTPAISSYDPNPASAAAPFTIYGTDMDLVEYIKVEGYNDVIWPSERSYDRVYFQNMPADIVSGIVTLVLVGESVTLECERIQIMPRVENMTAENGKFKADTEIVITGTDLDYVDAVYISSTEGAGVTITDYVLSVDNRQIIFEFPAGSGYDNVYLVPKTGENIWAGAVSVVQLYKYNLSVTKEGTRLLVKDAFDDLDVVSEIRVLINEVEQEVPFAYEGGNLCIDFEYIPCSGTISLLTKHGQTVSGLTYDFLPKDISFDPNPVSELSDMTITGTNLDLVESITFGGEKLVSDFKSQSSEEIVLTVPEGAQNGQLKFNCIDVSESEVTTIPELTIGSGGGVSALTPLTYPEGTKDITIEKSWFGEVEVGDKVKISYKTGGWGTLYFQAGPQDWNDNTYIATTEVDPNGEWIITWDQIMIGKIQDVEVISLWMNADTPVAYTSVEIL